MTEDRVMLDALVRLEAARSELDALEAVLMPAPSPAEGQVPRWLLTARHELGVTEQPGDQHNKRILDYLSTTSLGRWARERDETAWCSAFANWVMMRSGLEGTGSAMARSWLGWGIEIADPSPGCVVVLRRGAPPSGHVALFERTEGDTWHLLGGNQGNQVSVRPYPRSRVLSCRWPAEPGAT